MARACIGLRSLAAATAIGLRGLGLFALLPLWSCFSPDQPDCSFSCAASVNNQRHCPENYTCGDDDFCHRNGSSVRCAPDLAVATDSSFAVDQAASADASIVPDMSGHD